MEFIMNLNEEYLNTHSILYDGDLSVVKGLQLKERGDILINLSARQFNVPENLFVKEVTNTITHELMHKIIEENIYQSFTVDGEERVCVSMAEQK